ncbi:mannose-6-phosphate isomerase, class I [Candidatus Pantoea edessiphila]|uniref:mannose-6-phosphate isomerase n=1 Tax=Candidatus Pantoea edessiphila TaxID=2044610 RepID=A0A2P5SWU4_9GAMM|nr:mannose-6-phosphate isomerase, class I [Candidatus Pantoea edessiphila]PPI86794.1 mannose-6-phosphate isomerase, class I [Candidatus Pantoea edessiphila]
MILKLKNSLQYYEWGNKYFLKNHYNIKNPRNLPMAELWIGTHPKNPSKVYFNNKTILLSDVININPQQLLSNSVFQYFGSDLPFLFKILCVENPLSIQVHPNKFNAKLGFENENIKSIPLNSDNRIYKDDNYKPELIYAITPFYVLSGFKKFSQIIILLNKVIDINPSISCFQKNPNKYTLSKVLKYFLYLEGKEKLIALNKLKSNVEVLKEEPWNILKKIMKQYPEDNGLFLFLFFNYVFVKPGEAIFIDSGTPHTYLKGIAIEISANSDNVIRAGLTSKYKNIPEFLTNITYQENFLNQMVIKPEKRINEVHFPVKVKDFSFSIHSLQNESQFIYQRSMAILFCIAGQFAIVKKNKHVIFKSGESYFISADEMPINITGNGLFARVFNKLN